MKQIIQITQIKTKRIKVILKKTSIEKVHKFSIIYIKYKVFVCTHLITGLLR